MLIKRMAGLSTWDSKSTSVAQCEIKGEGREPNKVVNVSQVDQNSAANFTRWLTSTPDQLVSLRYSRLEITNIKQVYYHNPHY